MCTDNWYIHFTDKVVTKIIVKKLNTCIPYYDITYLKTIWINLHQMQAEEPENVRTTKMVVDEEFIPFQENSVDIVFSSLRYASTKWCNDINLRPTDIVTNPPFFLNQSPSQKSLLGGKKVSPSFTNFSKKNLPTLHYLFINLVFYWPLCTCISLVVVWEYPGFEPIPSQN